MRYISKLLVLVAVMLVAQNAMAQPPKRRNADKEEKAKSTVTVPMTERAKSQYPSTEAPADVVWKRDLYRVLDLTKEKNASLYYPVEPVGGSMNLFTYLFNLILDGTINVYEYTLDGNENFSPDNRIDAKELLEKYDIYYEEADGKIVVNNSDVPSGDVLSYFIKESYYYDHRRAEYNRRVTAICPVMHSSEEFSSEATKYPMFWLNYDEIAPLLTQQTLMSSSYNNVSTMSVSDYFVKGCYDGEIYKTVNLRNQTINQYCKDSTAVKNEQLKIEKQLTDFHKNLWEPATATEQQQDGATGEEAAEADDGKEEKEVKKEEKKEEKKAKARSDKKAKSSNSNSGSRISVRRQRR